MKLRGKLTLTFFAVGMVLTSVHIWSTLWLQSGWEVMVETRAETIRIADELADAADRTSESGLAYLLSGDSADRQRCWRALELFETGWHKLLLQPDVKSAESDILLQLDRARSRAQLAAQQLFEAYDANGLPNPEQLAAYRSAMGLLSDVVDELAADVGLHATSDNELARGRLIEMQLAVAGIAAAVAIAMGTWFGVRLTRPLFRLRDASLRLAVGDFDFSLRPTSTDEIGELTTAFTDMAAAIRQLLTTVAQQKTRLEHVFSSLSEMLLVSDVDGNITSANRAACEALGYQEQALLGKPLQSVLVSIELADLRERALGHEVHGASANANVEHQVETKDGKRINVALSVSQLVGADPGAACGLICVAQDLSERFRLEAELRQAQKLEAIGRLASGIAHEINTPTQFVSDSIHFARDATRDLLGILGKYQLVERALSTGNVAPAEAFEEARKASEEADLPYVITRLPVALERALEGLSRITAIVRSMKVFAYPDQRRMTAINLNEAVQSTLTVARNEYKYVAELETDFGELPPVTCYAGEINQAVLNLVVNAAHAIADHVGDGARGVIRVQTKRVDDAAVISVSDTGGGIPEEIRERIFEPFFTTKAVGRGTGQGLSLARSVIVERHHGQLSFRTERGKGTTFEIHLPLTLTGA